ncbi:85 kDa surface glycoprotein [Trypanosoma cruzi]|nr:85 kDa surface glycoprotein [Trypanosoma cruzi]
MPCHFIFPPDGGTECNQVRPQYLVAKGHFLLQRVYTHGVSGGSDLSDVASDDTWNDEYLCLNATVTNAVKDNDGFQLTGLGSRAIWLVNAWCDKVNHLFLSHNFTLVASVSIE